jgi:putative transposase
MDVMHTFGRDIKSSPHIHMLITCGGLDPTCTRWVKCDFIPAAYLKKHWKIHFLNLIKQCWIQQNLQDVPPRLLRLFDPAYQRAIITQLLEVTWYVHIGEKLLNSVFTVRYIGRYTKRPAIAESRITAYDGKTVTFNFVDHKTDQSCPI